MDLLKEDFRRYAIKNKYQNGRFIIESAKKIMG